MPRGRPKGSKVIRCKKCEGRMAGLPRQKKVCPYCGTVNIVPGGKKKK